MHQKTSSITEATRRDIFDHLSIGQVNWSGRFNDRDFLARLFDLDALPSHDRRFSSASGDIAMHTQNFNDWTPDWIFTDSRFNLLRCADEELLRFLVETVHPVVRHDAAVARELVARYNSCLKHDGWEMYEAGEMAGRPVFRARRLNGRAIVFPEPTGWAKVDRQIQEARSALIAASSEEQFQSVGLLSREALISVGQHCYSPQRHKPVDGTVPTATDAKRILEAIMVTELAGASNDEARAHARAAVKLADALQHKRTADFRMAALCLEATVSVVNILAVLFGRRTQI
jgi:hypothetical protein